MESKPDQRGVDEKSALGGVDAVGEAPLGSGPLKEESQQTTPVPVELLHERLERAISAQDLRHHHDLEPMLGGVGEETLAKGVHEGSELLGPAPCSELGDQRAARVPLHLPEHRKQESPLRSETLDHVLEFHRRPARDVLEAGVVEAMLAEFGDRGVENPVIDRGETGLFGHLPCDDTRTSRGPVEREGRLAVPSDAKPEKSGRGPGRPPDPERQRFRRRVYLDAGIALYLAQGYEGLRVVDLGRLTGLSKRSMYLDFESKDDLFVEIGVESLAALVEKVHSTPRGESGATAIGVTLARFVRERPAESRIIFLELSAERLARATTARVARLRRQHQELLSGIADRLEQEGAPSDIARDGARAAVAAIAGVVLISESGSLQLGFRDAREIERLISRITAATVTARNEAGD